jgi:phosphatidylserine/phosphatidylglycerophosphate/cardiolipin synthase-like enzyme
MGAMKGWVIKLMGVLVLLWLAVGCGPPFAAPPKVAPPTSGSGELWQDDAIFNAVHRLLAGVGNGGRLWVEMYEFDRPDLESALLEAHKRGADVRLIVDPTVAVSHQTADRLAGIGIAVRYYPVDDRSHQIDHVKLVWTEQAALVAGMNWGRHSAANHDFGLTTEDGSELKRLEAIYEQDWSLAGGTIKPLTSLSGTVGQTAPGQEIRTLLLNGIESAGHSIDAEIYTLTDGQVLAGLAGAQHRGVRVRVIVDPNQPFNLRAVQSLRSGGIEVRDYPVPKGALLHAKAALFDDRTLLLGSANWTRSGLSVNHEVDLETNHPAAAAAFAVRFEQDWVVSGQPTAIGTRVGI